MYSPWKFTKRIGNIGSPLPAPFLTLDASQIQFRHGATSMIAGTPGSFKSVLALNMLAEWAKAGIGCLYFSADSEEFTVVKRLGGILTGDPIDLVEKKILQGSPGKYVQALRDIKGTEFAYTQMDMNGIANYVKSYEAIYGAYPEAIFIDNLIDFVESPDDWGGMLIMTRELDALARSTKSHICILHHARLRMKADGKLPDYGRPPADYEIQGKITQIPRLVLTVTSKNLTMKLACVKNTNGPQFRDGSVSHEFQVLNSMAVKDLDFAMGRV